MGTHLKCFFQPHDSMALNVLVDRDIRGTCSSAKASLSQWYSRLLTVTMHIYINVPSIIDTLVAIVTIYHYPNFKKSQVLHFGMLLQTTQAQRDPECIQVGHVCEWT